MAITQSAQPVQEFTTTALPQRMRLDSYMNFLSESLWQVTDWDSLPEDFDVRLSAASLGCLTIVNNCISAHHSHRTKRDVERSVGRNFHLFVSANAPWAFTHSGRHERLEIGDVVLMGEGEHETHAPDGFEGVIVKCPEHWVHTWVPDPELITGRSFRHDRGWGRVLSPLLRTLTPEVVTASPLPAAVLADQLGSVLALLAGDTRSRQDPALLARIRQCIQERCAEPGLTASEVALSLGTAHSEVHRLMLAANTTFAAELRRARRGTAVSVAVAPLPAGGADKGLDQLA